MVRKSLPIAFILLLCSPCIAEKAPAKVPTAKKTYICTASGAIWNQNRPCGESTPERAEIFKRISTSDKPHTNSGVTIRLQEQVYGANLAQIWNYPERYAGHEVQVNELYLSGNIQRSYDSKIPEGQRTVATVFDRYGRSLALTLNDGAGHRMLGSLSPNKRYPVSTLKLRISRTPEGYLPELITFELADSKIQYVKADLQIQTDPLIPLAPELRANAPESHEAQAEAGTDSEQVPQGDDAHVAQSKTEEESFPTESSDLPDASRKKIQKLTGAYQKLGSIFEGGSAASEEEAPEF